MMSRGMLLLAVACILLMWISPGHAQDVIWVVETAAPDVPTDVRTPFALDARERRPTAEPGPPVRLDDDGTRLPNGWSVIPPPGVALRGRRSRPVGDIVALQDTLPPPVADAPPPPPPPSVTPPVTPPPPPPAWTAPKRAPIPYASPQYAPQPQAYASPQYAPQPQAYASPQYVSGQSITGFTLDEIDRFSVERRHYARPRVAARWVEGPPPQTYAAAASDFTAAPCAWSEVSACGLVPMMGAGPSCVSGFCSTRGRCW